MSRRFPDNDLTTDATGLTAIRFFAAFIRVNSRPFAVTPAFFSTSTQNNSFPFEFAVLEIQEHSELVSCDFQIVQHLSSFTIRWTSSRNKMSSELVILRALEKVVSNREYTRMDANNRKGDGIDGRCEPYGQSDHLINSNLNSVCQRTCSNHTQRHSPRPCTTSKPCDSIRVYSRPFAVKNPAPPSRCRPCGSAVFQTAHGMQPEPGMNEGLIKR